MGILTGFIGGKDSGSEELTSLLELISGLKEKFKGNKAGLSEILSALKPRLEKLAGSDEGGLASILSGLEGKLKGVDVDGILGSLLGGGGSLELSDEEIAELDKSFEEQNQRALAETGDSVPNKKVAESIEEFYGDWNYSKIVAGGEEFDLSDSGIGMFFGENTFYYTMDGEMSTDDGTPPEVQEMKLDNGLLKYLIGNVWTVCVLTQDGELVELGNDSMSYYIRPAK